MRCKDGTDSAPFEALPFFERIKLALSCRMTAFMNLSDRGEGGADGTGVAKAEPSGVLGGERSC